MKVAVIGGAGVRTPLLVRGLTASDLPIREIALYDLDRRRLRLIGALAERFRRGAHVTLCDSSAACLEGADYIFTAIRVGGIETRASDEAVVQAHGIIGQETVGPGGFAMAMRTIPAMIAYAREIARYARGAWVINFTNPVGIMTQAVSAETGIKIIGICDTPTALFERIAHVLDLEPGTCFFDYFGLNHLGWVREVYHRGEPQLHRLWGDDAALGRVYRTPLFEVERLQRLRLLPTEYLYYYYRAGEAYEHVRRAGQVRGQAIARLNAQLFERLEQPGDDPARIYEDYLTARSGGYMQVESGAQAPQTRAGWEELTGYDKIALETVRAIHFNSGAVIPLNVLNRGNLPELEPDDIIEVPCAVSRNGARALHAGPMPDAVRDQVVQVKAYERATIHAALTRDPRAASAALARNPLVPSEVVAERLVSALGVA